MRLAQAATLVAVSFGALNCTDNGVGPLVGTSPIAGLASSYDSVTPPEHKLFNQDPAAFLAPLYSLRASAAASSAASAATVAAASVQFAPESGPFAWALPGCDDCFYGPFPINFGFRYFGNTYSNFYVSTNGFVTFTPIPPSVQLAGCCQGRTIPAADNINNVIALAWGDLDTRGVSNALSFETRGSAPNRRLIVNFKGAKNLNEINKPVTAQLVLYEGSNNIELHTAASSAVRFNHTQGVENHLGTQAGFIPGRVAAKYTLTNDAVRFTGAGGNAVPVAIPGGNAGVAPNLRYEGVEGAAVNFVGSGADLDNDPLTYQWDFNNDGTIDAENAQGSFTYADNGTYKARLIVNDGREGVGEALVNVVIKNADPSVDAGSDVQVIAGQIVNFSGRFSDAGVNDAPWGWTWSLGSQGDYNAYGTTEDQSVPIPGSHRFCGAGSFTARFTVVDKDGGSGSDAVAVTVEAIPLQIDINPNVINLNGEGNGMITVRIYSRPDFDATALNAGSLKLTSGTGRGATIARTGGGLLHWNPETDLNGDGLLDATAQFRRDELAQAGDLLMSTTHLMLMGKVGDCGDVLGKAEVRVKVNAKKASAASTLQPTGPAATPADPTNP